MNEKIKNIISEVSDIFTKRNENMTTYIVTFDVSDQARKLQIIEVLKRFRAFCPIHANAWAIATENKASEVRDAFKPYITSTDKLFVIRSGTESAWINLYGAKNSEWLKKHL